MSLPVSKTAAIHELYRRGVLSFKLDPLQKELSDKLALSKEKVNVVLCSRRLGKSYWASTLAIEQCLKKPNSIVKILAPTKLMITSILRPLFREILKDCPEDLTPREVKNRFTYNFPNGSMIELAGSDSGHAEKLRGSFSDLAIVDEAGFCSDLQNTVRSILIPTTMNTKGKILLLSTPPKEPDHEFMTFVEEADDKNCLVRKTIYDNPRIKTEEIEEIIKAYPGGANDPEFRREFLCEIIKDPSMSVIPEFTAEVEKEVIKEHPKPPFFDAYVSMDLGFQDLTAVLFGYFDFRSDKVIIEDEMVLTGEQLKLDKFAKDIEKKEEELWFNHLTREIKKPYLRVSDINHTVTQEIYRNSGGRINFVPTKKDDKQTALNTLRVMIAAKKIIISPKCQTLIKHLRNVKWYSPNNKTKFGRSPDMGHYDCVDALIYMTRAILYTKNPYPAHYDLRMQDLFINNPKNFYNEQNDAAKMFQYIFDKRNHRSKNDYDENKDALSLRKLLTKNKVGSSNGLRFNKFSK